MHLLLWIKITEDRKCHLKLSSMFYWMLWKKYVKMALLIWEFTKTIVCVLCEDNALSVPLWHGVSLQWKNSTKHYFLLPQLEVNKCKLILYSATCNSHRHTYKMHFFFIFSLHKKLFSTKASHSVSLLCEPYLTQFTLMLEYCVL